jgi:hypothetical protein
MQRRVILSPMQGEFPKRYVDYAVDEYTDLVLTPNEIDQLYAAFTLVENAHHQD